MDASAALPSCVKKATTGKSGDHCAAALAMMHDVDLSSDLYGTTLQAWLTFLMAVCTKQYHLVIHLAQ